jgi:hypothetical protein
MRKFVTLGIAAVFAALPLAMTTMPANAGGISFGFGGYGYDDWYDDDIVIELDVDDIDIDDVSDMDRHTEWCEDHFQTYDEDTDLYFYAPGKQKHCESPWS